MIGAVKTKTFVLKSENTFDIAYREDTRRKSNGAIANDILTRCLSREISNEFSGYWQGNKRVAERLGA